MTPHSRRAVLATALLVAVASASGCDDAGGARPDDADALADTDDVVLVIDTEDDDTDRELDTARPEPEIIDDSCFGAPPCCECAGSCPETCYPCGACFTDCTCPDDQYHAGDYGCRAACDQPDTIACVDRNADGHATCWHRCTSDDDCFSDQLCAADGLCVTRPDCPLPTCGSGALDGTAVCDPSCEHPADTVCADANADGTATCFFSGQCVATDDCPSGTVCSEHGECETGTCLSTFDHDCPDGQTCVPSVNQSYFCSPGGAGLEGEVCMAHADCSPDLLCVGTCWRPECAPLSGSPACAAGETCRGLSLGAEPIDVGDCVELCDPLALAKTGRYRDTCGAAGDGRTCQIDDTRSADGTLDGVCVDAPDGLAGPGEPCDDSSPQTTCGTTDNGLGPLICVGGTCETICDPDDQSTCPADGQGCFPITLQSGDGATFAPDWGLCDETCTPSWCPDDPGVGCEAGEYCWPDFDVTGLGRCFTDETGTGREGDSCDVETRGGCDDLHLCFTSEADAQGNPTAAECQALCDPSAPADTACDCVGDASDGQQRTCIALQVDDGMGNPVALPVGTCSDTCDLGDLASAGCSPANDGGPRYCQLGELFGFAGVDLCVGGPEVALDPGDDCDAAGLPAGAFCRDNGFCLDLGTGSVCTEACHPAGVDNPPECSLTGGGATVHCVDPGLGVPDLGLCQL